MQTLDKAKVIAEEKAKELGYNIDELKVIVDEQNTVWIKYRENVSEEIPDLDKKLQNKQYWAIYYKPKEINQFGGDLFVFIDKKTGTIIGYLRGQ